MLAVPIGSGPHGSHGTGSGSRCGRGRGPVAYGVGVGRIAVGARPAVQGRPLELETTRSRPGCGQCVGVPG